MTSLKKIEFSEKPKKPTFVPVVLTIANKVTCRHEKVKIHVKTFVIYIKKFNDSMLLAG